MSSLLAYTEKALGGPALVDCQSRSLRLTRYARPDLSDKTTPTRKQFLDAVTKAHRESASATATIAWQRSLPRARTLHARLEARLLLDMAGSVLENAGLGLDRYGSVPIPGSAVKGCARRAALATLRQWSETGSKPGDGDLFSAAAEPFAEPEGLLLGILRVFGCSDLEWQAFDTDTNEGNDLAWACGAGLEGDRDRWPACRSSALATLNADTATPDETAPNRRGAIAFLPAYPSRTPKPDLELDVLTPHHKDYYASADPRAVSLDIEDPIPVFFPAVASGTDYSFSLVPLGAPRTATAELLEYAVTWLATGLTTFGLGAKVAAGYGWFTNVTEEVEKREAEAAAKRREADAKAAEEARRAEAAATRKARDAAIASMTPEQRADVEFAERVGDRGRLKDHLARFAETDPKKQLTDDQKGAILRWFATPGPGRDLWLAEIKTGQGKPKDRDVWRRIIGSIHAAKKSLKIDLP
jgi:CRISPR/Cas system CMR subunit Cmr6 (Cas7 group RAMP superfamily)